MANLLTNHDPNHLHALCGLMALIHHLYRYYLLMLDVPDGGFGRNGKLDILSLIITMLPNATSFIFDFVPAKKSPDGFTIWKEYRWHAFIFCCKLWLLQCLHVYARYNFPNGNPYEVYIAGVSEFGTMFVAQYITDLYPKQESTIRGMYKTGWAVFMAGFMQFLGRASVFYGTPEPRDMIAMTIVGIFFIQLNAFNMTLRKKRITGRAATQAFYSLMLFSAFYMILLRRLIADPPTGLFDVRFKPIYLAALAYYSRRSGVDRYSSWLVALAAMALATQQFNIFEAGTGAQEF